MLALNDKNMFNPTTTTASAIKPGREFLAHARCSIPRCILFLELCLSAYLNESALILRTLFLLDTSVPNSQIDDNLIDVSDNTLPSKDRSLFDALHAPSIAALSRYLFLELICFVGLYSSYFPL